MIILMTRWGLCNGPPTPSTPRKGLPSPLPFAPSWRDNPSDEVPSHDTHRHASTTLEMFYLDSARHMVHAVAVTGPRLGGRLGGALSAL